MKSFLRVFFNRMLNIGLNRNMALNLSHGVIWAQKPNGGIEKYPFLADKPEQLNKPGILTLWHVEDQVIRMGLQPVHLEVFTNNTISLYTFNSSKPVFQQAA